MRTNRLTILAALSVALFAVLLCGYFATFGPSCYWYTRINAATATVHIPEISLDHGGIRIIFQNFNTAYIVSPGSTDFRFHPFFKNASFGLPRARTALWEFEAGPLAPFPSARRWGFVLVFPIWCLALPAAVTPFLWLRRRRRLHDRAASPSNNAVPRQ